MTVMPKLFVIIPRDHLRVAVQKVIRGTVGIAQVRFIDIHREIHNNEIFFIASYPMAYGALQRFVWDFGQTALSSLQFLKEIFVDTPILRIEAIPQH